MIYQKKGALKVDYRVEEDLIEVKSSTHEGFPHAILTFSLDISFLMQPR